MGMSAAGTGGVVDIDDVPVGQTWDRLKTDPTTILVDVRTKPEWGYVGIPDLAPLGKQVLLQEWQVYPTGQVDPQFAEKLAAQLTATGATKDHDIFFICRSGARSRAAASAMAARGYSRCHNVADGFEGPLDSSRQRGKAGGWKAAGLPWAQS